VIRTDYDWSKMQRTAVSSFVVRVLRREVADLVARIGIDVS